MATRTDAKAELRRLIDELPDEELHAARRFLEFLRDRADPLLRALRNAPEDDEPLNEEDLQAIREGRADAAAGRVLSTAELRKALEERP